MAEKKYDIAIAYRAYPGVAKDPPVYADDKFRLTELCLSSFKDCLGSLKVKFYAVLDACPTEYEELVRKYFPDDCEVIHTPGIGNGNTFLKQMEILLGQDDSDLIYFAEDDYFYLPGLFHEMIELMQEFPEIDFVSPYDHTDYYELPLHDYKSRIIAHGGRHWRSASTTCLTFMARKEGIRRNLRLLKTYAKKNKDAGIWLSMTKKKVFSPSLHLKALFSERWMSRMLLQMWYFGWPNIFFGKKHQLYTPMPSIATHMIDKQLAKGIDWRQKFEEKKNDLGF